ncbi:uncharacterized protein [Montipora capricornis]|uniref:uncharacterized protein n=1 Tax=Montipora capricornis TaxID=246305 RepID=UPI0035F16D82
MLTFPRLQVSKDTASETLPRLVSDRRKKISRVGKVFPKKSLQGKVDGKLDFHCVGLEKDKNVSLPSVDNEKASSSLGTEERRRSIAQEPDEGDEVTLPELPSILGSRRGSVTLSPSPDANDRLDLLVKGEARKDTQSAPEGVEMPVDLPLEEVMRSNLEPLIDTLFEEDELFLQDFEGEGLDRILFIRKMGIYVEIKTKEYIPGIFCTPLFHCPRCKEHWMEFGTVPQNCQFARQPTRGPAIHLAKNKKPRFGVRGRKKPRRLGDIKEGYVVSGSGTVLNEFAEDKFEDPADRPMAHSSMENLALPSEYLISDDVNLEDVGLSRIDVTTIVEAFKEGGDSQNFDKETYVTNLAEALGLDVDKLMETFEEVVSVKQARLETYVREMAVALCVDVTRMAEAFKKVSKEEAFKEENFAKTMEAEVGIDSTKIIQAFEEVVSAKKKVRIEAYSQDIAAALGVDLTKVKEAFENIAHLKNLDEESLAKAMAAEMGIDSTKIMQTFEEVVSAKKKVRIEGYSQDIAAALGVDLTTVKEAFENIAHLKNLDEESLAKAMAAEMGIDSTKIMQAFEEVVSARKERKETYSQDIAAALGVNLTTVKETFEKVAHLQDLDEESLVRAMAAEMGIDSTTIREALKKVATEQNLDEEAYADIIKTTVGFEDIPYNDVSTYVTENIDDLKAVLASCTTSANVESFVKLTLNSNILKNMTVKDLPERIKEKILSLLRSQRESTQKRALLKEKGPTGADNSDGSDARKELCGKGIETGVPEITCIDENNTVLDMEGSHKSGSSSDVLASKKTQSKHRSRKKNKSVKNRSEQPPISLPSNSSAFSSAFDGDGAEETWGLIRAPRVGSSRAHLTASRTSLFMPDTARAPHGTDSRTSMLGKYSRAMGSARGRKDASFSNLDDQMSYGSVVGDDDNELDDHDLGSRSKRARHASRKKEKGDGVKRPGNYHSRLIKDIPFSQENPSSSPSTATFVDSNMTHGSNARLSQARLSRLSLPLSNASNAVSCDSIALSRRSSRPASSVTVTEHAQKRRPTPEPSEPLNAREDTDKLPPLTLPGAVEAAVPVDSDATTPTQAELNESESNEELENLFTPPEKREPLVSIEDLMVIHRLPVSSAFTYSFYKLPIQYRLHNESIKKAANRIGRKKMESSHFRSKSAP